MFHTFFDVHEGDGIIQKTDISELLDKLRTYCGYLRIQCDSKYMQMNDVMFAFYNAMLDHVRKERACSEEAEGYSTVNLGLKSCTSVLQKKSDLYNKFWVGSLLNMN